MRLLIVEDSEDDALLIVRNLQRAGYEPQYERVDSATAVRGALDGGPWDIIVSDFNMPQFSGTEALRILRERDPDTPFIFVSGTIGEDVAVEAMRGGAQDYVTKGNLRRLVPAIERELRDAAARRERRASDERYRLLFHRHPHPLWVFDRQTLRFLDVNEAAIRHYGYTREEFLAMTIEAIRPTGELPELHTYLQHNPGGLAQATGWRHKKKDGTIIDVEITSHDVELHGRPTRIVSALDVTERRRAETALQARARQQAAVAELGQRAIETSDVLGLLDTAPTLVSQTLGVPYAKVLELEQNGETLRLRAGVGWHAGCVGQTTLGAGTESQAGYTLQHNAPVVVEDLRTETRFRSNQLLHEHDVVSGVTVVIPSQPRPFGVLGAHTDRPRAFTQDDIHFLQAVAHILGTAIDRDRAERIQAAVYRIADAAQRASDLQDYLRSVHEIVQTLMPAKSFYIALYDERADLITFPYFVDEMDPPPPPRRPGRGITDHVLRTGQPLLVKPDSQPLEMEESVGTPSIDWLGVPLKAGGRTVGVLAVQTYTAGVRYEERDKEMLQFVSTQIATAIQRKRDEEALRHSEERFRALVERSGDAIALLDRTGMITYASPSTAAVLGREADAVVGLNAFALLHPGDIADVRQLLGGMRDGPGVAFLVQSRFLHGDGTWHVGEGTVSNRLADPAVQAIVFNYRDVSERHRLEERLRQSQKMEAVGRLAGGIAHDFNNVLTAVFGYVDLLREELPATSAAQHDLTEIRTAAERAAALTRQLLAFSRQQVLEPVILRLNDLIEDFEKMLRRVIGEDIDVRLVLGEDAGNVRADPGQLHQVVMNLVVNARDAMPTGGTLTLETAVAELDEEYAELQQPVVPGRYVLLAVSDSGTGMTPDVRARIFEPFFTTKEKGKGTGLGLSTVYGIVKQSGGYVWAYSEPGRGTTFKIYLPLVDAPTTPAPRLREAQSVTGHETILLAEDDAMLRPLATGVLQKLGYTVLDAGSADQALARAAGHDGPIHLLLADVVMPGASGRDLARRLAETRPDTKVLYVSGYTDDAIVHHGILEPGLNFLQKPFTPAVLARRVREVLDAT